MTNQINQSDQSGLIVAESDFYNLTKEWLKAQCLFYGLISPESAESPSKDVIFARLKQNDSSYGNNISPNKAAVLEIFHNLEEQWALSFPQHQASRAYYENKILHVENGCWCFATHYTRDHDWIETPTEDNCSSVTKRKLEVDKDAKSEEDIKASSPEPKLQLPFRSRTPSRSLRKRQRKMSPSPEPENYEEVVTYTYAEQPSEPLPDTEGVDEDKTSPCEAELLPSLSAPRADSSVVITGDVFLDMLSSYSHWHSLLELRDYFYNVTATYMIFTEAFQGLGADSLRRSIKINYLKGHSTKFGVLEAYLDFAVVEGPVILGLDKNFTAEYLWATASDREL
ncbi:hypothetical protein PtrSN002B_010707 [Pyrenophora tritici-repentis]|uniref:Uncharacterized protein n=2 Tax=Pyrenophora tritici-repentis TaxID=45151 RepID=A0A2W1FE48_9PLEO|nr:uncharacterized protein PTRG_10576 [Pyrenophora tritici-repentis Pt-1C-BFP]KAA8621232.1 hypothetical protein PtrV1_05733 [Pyrenophora tritici-repentis]EDU43626.1 predicted protein [Pyrenophora tritici-repentis Pt-1C-BFP]KAF7450474.1 hypothetical protein A1F99_050900 [Pyrenophora tritici-repentis]KAG9381304.1 hypothetical protein A1F94_008624 [Pyrenophora tritici-repentis]KAI0570666.1 hypothetical protein Alg215_10914 [Pyrenophora tritici-repentis]